MFKILVCIGMGAGLVGCNSANSRVSPVAFGQSKGIVTSGNLRLVTERTRAGYPPIVCTEPSPDYMVAFGSERRFAGTAPTAAGARSVEVNLSTSELVTEGKGREAGVLALRDGLYTACQNYANGVIGQDAYSIILSQYGNLLVALVGSDSAAAKVEVSGSQAALSAMTVGCISGHDTSRHSSRSNLLLTKDFCKTVLQKVLDRAVGRAASSQPKPPKRDVKPEKPKDAATEQTGGSSVTTTTTTNTVVK